ncbi:Z-DNA-binding protein 1 [Carettochelys insculpta]|uniref:Z-DNA-binding protein 1 n=1 Tax=Carettochelys insculpta TaxID=44489 RepID=UPI003EBA88D6
MAKAAPSTVSNVEQCVWDHLQTTATPEKAREIARACSITKQEANKALYNLLKEGKVELQNDSHKWVVCTDKTDVESHQKSNKLKIDDAMLVPLHQPMTTVTPAKDDSKLTENQDKIYKFLSANGPQNALAIAKHMGKTTQKDVKADLYALQEKHLLSLEKTTKLWSVYRQGTDYKATSTVSNEDLKPIIFQNNPINFIYQEGAQNTVSIADSRATQIGNYNSLNLADIKTDYTLTAPSLSTESENANMLHGKAEAQAADQSAQEIDIIESTFKNTVIGNDNQMKIIMKDFPGRPEEHLDHGGIPEKNLVGDILSVSSVPSLKINTHPREGSVPLQRVCIDKSTMENVMIGNNNQMSVHEQHGSASLTDKETNEEDDGSDSNLTSEQSEQTSCDDSGLDQSCDISLLCEELRCVIIGNNNYMNVEEIADAACGEDEDK